MLRKVMKGRLRGLTKTMRRSTRAGEGWMSLRRKEKYPIVVVLLLKNLV